MKILFTDLDGTLLNDNKKISKKDLSSINEMIDLGHKFVITTGRPLVSAKRIAEKYGFLKSGFILVSFNGGLIYDCGQKKSLITRTIPIDMVKFIMDKAHKNGFHAHTYADDLVVSEYETPQLKIYCEQMKMKYIIVKDIRETNYPHINVVVKPPIKVNIITPFEHFSLVQFREEMEPFTKGKFFDVFSKPEMLEYSHLKSNKGDALRFVMEYYNVSKENSIAVGDEENDAPMIKAANIGISVLNGSDAAKQFANYVTENDNNDSAISEVIEKFVLDKKG